MQHDAAHATDPPYVWVSDPEYANEVASPPRADVSSPPDESPPKKRLPAESDFAARFPQAHLGISPEPLSVHPYRQVDWVAGSSTITSHFTLMHGQPNQWCPWHPDNIPIGPPSVPGPDFPSSLESTHPEGPCPVPLQEQLRIIDSYCEANDVSVGREWDRQRLLNPWFNPLLWDEPPDVALGDPVVVPVTALAAIDPTSLWINILPDAQPLPSPPGSPPGSPPVSPPRTSSSPPRASTPPRQDPLASSTGWLPSPSPASSIAATESLGSSDSPRSLDSADELVVPALSDPIAIQFHTCFQRQEQTLLMHFRTSPACLTLILAVGKLARTCLVPIRLQILTSSALFNCPFASLPEVAASEAAKTSSTTFIGKVLWENRPPPSWSNQAAHAVANLTALRIRLAAICDTNFLPCTPDMTDGLFGFCPRPDSPHVVVLKEFTLHLKMILIVIIWVFEKRGTVFLLGDVEFTKDFRIIRERPLTFLLPVPPDVVSIRYTGTSEAKPWAQMPNVIEFLRLIAEQQFFSVSYLQRICKDMLRQHGDYFPPKPYCLDVECMVAQGNFTSGKTPLPAADIQLNPSRLVHYHGLHCTHGCTSTHVNPACYFKVMLRTITHGWNPQFVLPVERLSEFRGNYPSCEQFPAAMAKAVGKWIDKDFIRPTTGQCGWPVALNAVVKNSDRCRASSEYNIDLTDQAAMDRYNVLRARHDLDPIKVRPTSDFKASGINAALGDFPFRAGTLHDAAAILSPGCWAAVIDIDTYFMCFSYAIEWRFWAAVYWLCVWYEVIRVMFGGKTTPHFAYAWAGELHSIFVYHGLRNFVCMDDHLFSAPSAPDIATTVATAKRIFKDLGFTTSDAKDQVGQTFVFTGVLFDTVNGTMSWTREAAGSALVRVGKVRAFLSGESTRSPSREELESLAGVFNHFSQLLLEGRLNNPFYAWLRRVDHPLSPTLRSSITAALDFWDPVLTLWASSFASPKTFPLLNAATLLAHPSKFVCIQTDASGPHGWGGYEGGLYDTDWAAWSFMWNTTRDGSRDGSHSTGDELYAWVTYLEATAHRDIILLLFTDSQAAAWCVNNGYSDCPITRLKLQRGLSAADSKGIFPVAFWLPRTENDISDFLSHLAFLLGRDIAGPLGTLLHGPNPQAPPQASGPAAGDGAEVQGFLQGQSSPAVPDALPHTTQVSPLGSDSTQGLGEVGAHHRLPPAQPLHPSPSGVADYSPGAAAPPSGAGDALLGRNPECPESPAPNETCAPHRRGSQAAAGGVSSTRGHRHVSFAHVAGLRGHASPGRGTSGAPRGGHSVVPRSMQLPPPPPSHEEPSQRPCPMGPLPFTPGTLRRPLDAPALLVTPVAVADTNGAPLPSISPIQVRSSVSWLV